MMGLLEIIKAMFFIFIIILLGGIILMLVIEYIKEIIKTIKEK